MGLLKTLKSPYHDQLDLLLPLGTYLIDFLDGVSFDDIREVDFQNAGRKCFLHCCAVSWLRRGMLIPGFPTNMNYLHFAGVAVVARPALETYLSLSEVYLSPTDEDEFKFRD